MVRGRIASCHYGTIPCLVIAVAVIALLFFLSSCDVETPPVRKPVDAADGIHETIEKDAVSVSLITDKQEMTVADRLTLTLSASCIEDWEVRFPGVDEKMGQFRIVDYQTSRPELSGPKRKSVKRSYVLEPFLAGDYIIPVLTIGFGKADETLDIETPEIKITVASLFPGKQPQDDIHDIRPPVTLPFSIPIWLYAVCFGAVAAVVALSFLFYRRASRKTDKATDRHPADIALSELDALAAEKLDEKGEVKRLYHGISNILRRYIERRFGIHAPEQTTEEFLADLERTSRFTENFNRLLKTFLRYCDLVKFAEHQPRKDDIRSAFESCREFVTGTREKDE